ncbi:MAG: hypothetical protein IPK88_13580 [Saprospiraceae bacterium]|nr:hypothetical protein [Candidatus Defluviibacterium haderslevense]
MNQTKFLLVFIIFATLISMQCNEECPQRFHVPAEIIPYQLEYHIGDTIRFVSKFEKNVHEIHTDMNYDMSKIDFIPNTVIDFLDTIGRSKISDYFIFYSYSPNYKEYILSKGQSLLEGQYAFLNDSFTLEYILIPKYPGNYFLTQKCGIWENFPGRCRHVYYTVGVDMNSGKNGNIELLKESEDTLYNKIDANSPNWLFYDKGGFCFRVVP